MRQSAILMLLGAFVIACSGGDDPVAPPEAVVPDAVVGAAGSPVYTGLGIAVDATVQGVNTKLCDTGPLPRAGGRIELKPLNATIAGVLSSTRLYCITTTVDNNRAISEGTVFGLRLTIGGNTITAADVHSMAGARCPPFNTTVPASSGFGYVNGLVINGRAITTRLGESRRFELINGYAVLNEVTNIFATPFHAGRTVVGLRVVINNPPAEILLGKSLAHIDCP